MQLKLLVNVAVEGQDHQIIFESDNRKNTIFVSTGYQGDADVDLSQTLMRTSDIQRLIDGLQRLIDFKDVTQKGEDNELKTTLG